MKLDKLVMDTAKAGWEVYNRKGTTYYAIATSTVAIIKAILNDENKIMPIMENMVKKCIFRSSSCFKCNWS